MVSVFFFFESSKPILAPQGAVSFLIANPRHTPNKVDMSFVCLVLHSGTSTLENTQLVVFSFFLRGEEEGATGVGNIAL